MAQATVPPMKGESIALRSEGQLAEERDPEYPDPDSVIAIPIPPVVGVITKFDSTMNCAVPTSFCGLPVNVRV
jgi:hypothetical protein